MKNPDIHNIKYYKAIAGYMSGEMSENEKRNFETKIRQYPAQKSAFNELENYWNIMEPDPKPVIIETESAWSSLRSRLESDGLIPEKSTSGTMFSMMTPLRWAASVLIIVSLGLIAFWGINLRDSAKLLTVTNGEDNLTLVQTFEDGTVVYMGKNSSITYPGRFNKKNRKVKLEGEAFFEVVSMPDRPFIVETKDAMIEVLGTSFHVNTNDNTQLNLYVESGKVQVSLLADSKKSVFVEKGESLSISNNSLEKFYAGQAYDPSWRRNSMQFKDETLSNIISVINANYSSKMLLEEQELANRRLTVTFYNNSLPAITELISLSLNLDYEVGADSSIIFKQKK